VGEAAAVDTAELVATLRQKGLRATSARVAVLASLSQVGHATVEHLHAVLVRAAPSMSLSTVYRTLESLAAHDLVRHAHLGGSVPSYYLAGGVEHAHLVCSRCGAVEDLRGQTLHRFVTEIAEVAGFATNTSHLSVEGLCATCQQAPAPPM
jgi:Fe2+ or Zn2+ uptake regulation protein